MTFASGNTTMDQLLNKISDDLIATGAWVDADPTLAGTKRAVRHVADNFYVYLERRVTSAPGGAPARWNEILVTVSTAFDTLAHVPSGTQMTTGIPAEAWMIYGYSYVNASYPGGNKAGQYWAWIDQDGVTLLVVWASDPTNYDYAVFFTLERNGAKEFADGYSNFFVASWANFDPDLPYSNLTSQYYANRHAQNPNYYWDLARPQYLRPFSFTAQSRGLSIEPFFNAYRSDGNAKVYFQFPFYSNNQDASRRMPIAQSLRWFQISTGLGVADGDVVDYVLGAQTLKYLAKTVQSADNAAFLPYAIRYA